MVVSATNWPVSLLTYWIVTMSLTYGRTRKLNTSVGVALARTTDRATRVHLEAVRDQIVKILDPRFASSNAAAATVRLFGFEQLDSFLRDSDTCWTDYIIRP